MCFPHSSCRQWRDLAQGLVDRALRDHLARLCNSLVRFLAKAVLDPIVWMITKDWAAFKSGALDEVVFSSPVLLHDSLAESLHLALGAVLGVSGWRLDDLEEVTTLIVDEVINRARSVINNVMDLQSSIPLGFMSGYTVSPPTLSDLVYSMAVVLQGHLSWPIVSDDRSSTELTDDLVSARPAALEDLMSGDLLRDIPVEPYQYVYTEGWKRNNKGVRGLFELHRLKRQDEHSHKLRLFIQQSLAEAVPAPFSVAVLLSAPPAAPPAAPAAPPAAPTASTKRKSFWKHLFGKRRFKVPPMEVPTGSTSGKLFKTL